MDARGPVAPPRGIADLPLVSTIARSPWRAPGFVGAARRGAARGALEPWGLASHRPRHRLSAPAACALYGRCGRGRSGYVSARSGYVTVWGLPLARAA